MYEISKLAVEIANENISLQKANTIALIDIVYWQYIYSIEKYSLAENYFKMLFEFTENIKYKYQLGGVNKSNLIKTQIKTNQAELEKLKISKKMKLALLTLCRYIGVNQNSSIVFEDNKILIKNKSNIYEIETNASNRPEYLITQKLATMSKRAIKLTNSEFLPQVGVSVKGSYFNGIKINDYNT